MDRILLYSEAVTTGWQAMFSQLRQNLTFSGQLREMIILRIAILNGASYEFTQHAPIALTEGVSQAEIDALSNWPLSSLFDIEAQAVLAYVDAMTEFVQVPDAIYTDLEALFNEKQIVEITTLIAGYNMVSRFLEALQITAVGE